MKKKFLAENFPLLRRYIHYRGDGSEVEPKDVLQLFPQLMNDKEMVHLPDILFDQSLVV